MSFAYDRSRKTGPIGKLGPGIAPSPVVRERRLSVALPKPTLRVAVSISSQADRHLEYRCLECRGCFCIAARLFHSSSGLGHIIALREATARQGECVAAAHQRTAVFTERSAINQFNRGSAWQGGRCQVLGRRAGPGRAIVAVAARQACLAPRFDKSRTLRRISCKRLAFVTAPSGPTSLA